jgi:CheY-like chemotaxis protein
VVRDGKPELDSRAGAVEQGLFQLVLDHEDNRAVLERRLRRQSHSVELASGGKLSRTPLEAVAKIAEPRDPVWEGPVVGAALGGLFWALCGSGCDAGYMLRATADYALIGLVLDAATSTNKTIYKGGAGARPSLSFRFRF